MKKEIAQRIELLRELMSREHLAAFIFPTADPHQSEYTADHWKGREWISGFNGSAGTAVVTLRSAALWTDSRYFLAAGEQLSGTEFQLMRLKMEGTPTVAEWLGQQLSSVASPEVGIDGMVWAASEVKALIGDLRQHGGITLRTNLDPLRQLWTDRPPIPRNPVALHPMEFAGESTASKLARIRKALHGRHADGILMAALDDIAWTLNLRGTDVSCNPVFVSYLLITSRDATLYINKEKLTPTVRAFLEENGIGTDDYANVAQGLRDYFEQSILIDPDEVNYTLWQTARRERSDRSATTVIEAPSPVPAMKIVKNATEQLGFRQAMLRDGIAMVRFLCWLDHQFTAPPASSTELTELSIANRLAAFRAEQPHYRGLSFDTIAAYGEHGAIVHYEPTPQSDIPLRPEGLLLLDSGAQYLDGTTDITRTIALGPLTDEQRRVYTLVLKGHLRLQNLVFPDGAAGTQLDAIARAPLWHEGLNYLHGTGHGVGSYLCVHEGPHQIRMEWKPQPLRAGMTVTDEPGIYLAGRFGVRIENALLIVPAMETECGRFLHFEPLTLCPIDKRPIMTELLSAEERGWLDSYHQTVYERLAPMLNPVEQQWLRDACAPLS